MSERYWLNIARYGSEEERWAAVLRSLDYSYRRWLDSPLIQRLLTQMEEGAAIAAEARLAAATASLRASTLSMAAAELGTTLVLPLQIWVEVYVMLGAPYRKAQILVRNENFVSGFSQGFVTGLLRWDWPQTRSRFARFSPDFNTSGAFDLGFISANARNEGLRNGYIHASLFPDIVKKKILSLLRSGSPGTQAGNWSRNEQISFVIELAAAGRRSRFFR